MLTIAYITARKDPKIDWFFDSLARQLGPHDIKELRIVIVDFFARAYKRAAPPSIPEGVEVMTVTPKPNVWQGEYRLTKEDWFAASNSRNSALCLAPDGFLAYVDDLSVLLPGWLPAVREHMAARRFGFGAYLKANNLVVEDGKVISYTPKSTDNRLGFVSGDVTKCTGKWLYGCSLCGPVEMFTAVGGWPEFCDGLGFEDCVMGHALENRGFPMVFDRRMMTIESEEDHTREPAFKRSDYGQSPNDKSHAALGIGKQSQYFPNYYEGGIPAMREKILAGAPWPIVQNPQHCWFSGKHLSEL